LVAAALVIPAGGANGDPPDLTFSGELQRVTADSIAIRQADGIIIEARNTATDGDLSPGSLSQRYALGDQVEITCARIVGVYSAQAGRFLWLQLEALEFLRAPSEEERRKALASKAWRYGANLLQRDASVLLRRASPGQPLPGEASPGGPRPATAPNELSAEPTTEWPARAALTLLPDGRLALSTEPTPEWPARLEHIRSHILAYAAELPNFVADEVAKRYVSGPSQPPHWRLVDTIKSEITVHGGRVSRAHITVSGKPWNSPYGAIPGSLLWGEGFGSQLPCLFAPGSPTVFEPGAPVNEGGKLLSVVRFSSPPDECEFVWTTYQQFYPSRMGRIWLTEPEEDVVRLEMESLAFPSAFALSAFEKGVSWGIVKIGGGAHLLPVLAEITSRDSHGGMTLTRSEYKNHRHFEVASHVTFQ
jgi:hypothetical protein